MLGKEEQETTIHLDFDSVTKHSLWVKTLIMHIQSLRIRRHDQIKAGLDGFISLIKFLFR